MSDKEGASYTHDSVRQYVSLHYHELEEEWESTNPKQKPSKKKKATTTTKNK